MPTYTQANSPLAITTPLGKDVLLLTGIRGSEAISQLFDFQLDLLAEVKSEVHFDGILGQNVTVKMGLPNGETRCFNGIVKRFSQGSRDETFLHFRAEMVPKLWLLTKKVQSRVFQHLSVPDILHQVLAGLDVTYEILATYYPRDFCVQYRESDFDFVSRLMEEEGIYYFFKHSDGGHQMVVTDVPNQHPELPIQPNVVYEPASGAVKEDMHVTTWEKTQELRSGEYTLWDHCFELPGNHLEAKEKTVESVTVGEVTHKLKVGGNDQLEIYEYPGGYAQRFDGIDRNGQPRPQDLQSVFRDNQRTVRVRMEQEDATSLEIEGASDCGHFLAGHKFKLQHHFDGDGEYLLTRIEHDANLEGDSHNYQELKFKYSNRFTCIPVALPYRPQRVTNRPVIAGVQTATVVGPSGEEIFCDKYGRVKVQFHWDREGKKDANSSCWLRVAQVWAGNGWGAFFWPRVGHEVVVIFEEGDPDQPVIIGSVYNAENLPPFSLPKLKAFGGFKSCSVQGSSGKNFNGVMFVDSADHEHLVLHSERHMVIYAEYDKTIRGGRHQAERVPGTRSVTVGGLPFGGGSGGGPNKNLWQTPEPLSIGGLNSVVVYGGNFQIAFPLNMQLAYGTNLQICVNPASFGKAFPATADTVAAASTATTQLLGSGLGGNMQITLGTSANVIMGQSINVTIGPTPISIGYQDKAFANPAALKLGNVLNLVVLIFLLAYTIPDDDFRSLLLMAFQIAVQITLYLIMDFHMLCNKVDGTANKMYDDLFAASDIQSAQAPGALEGPGASESLLLAAILPALLESTGEIVLDSSSSS
jgi:type VI secretion system secreted protein VgrG